MKTLLLDYYYEFNYYQVLITYKRMRNITYHYDSNKRLFKVSAPLRTNKKEILKYLDKFAPKLLNAASKKKSPYIENNIYIFGKLIPFMITSKNKVFDNHIEIKKKEDMNKLLKKLLKEYLINKVAYYENLFNVNHYLISVKNMTTRHGSNSKYSHRLSFATSLVHYNYPIIDSVIIHELAHDKYFDHSKNFYNYLYEKCPRYKEYKKALDENNYAYE